MGQLTSITVDCKDAEALAAFWVQVLDGYETDAEWKMVLNSLTGPTIYFQGVPEPKIGKNRLHLDMQVDDRAAEVERLQGLGATVFAEHDEGGHRWTVMQDPEGNEFCVTQRA